MKPFIHSTKLLNCYKKGKLDRVIKKFDEHINDQTFLGAGDDASTFIYNDYQVLKITTKESRYFQTFKGNKKGSILSQGLQFKKHIDDFFPYFLPVEEILYEDKNILIYTQDFCKKIRKKTITRKHVISIFKMVRLMFDLNQIVTDIGPHNIGVYKGQPCLFDYHSLQPIQINGQITDVNLNRMCRNLTRYMAFIYAPHRNMEYKESMKSHIEKSIKIIEKDNLIPLCHIALLKYLIKEKNPKSKKIIRLLDHCIDYLSHKKGDPYHLIQRQVARI